MFNYFPVENLSANLSIEFFQFIFGFFFCCFVIRNVNANANKTKNKTKLNEWKMFEIKLFLTISFLVFLRSTCKVHHRWGTIRVFILKNVLEIKNERCSVHNSFPHKHTHVHYFWIKFHYNCNFIKFCYENLINFMFCWIWYIIFWIYFGNCVLLYFNGSII